ncbi:hypothetical protein B0O99DRAFT_30176 [Bisporella sp. PMI_857]|nr:hypothetical protein B0O99DRAFT_30176 [Bisporella sp. PMI_857]
MSRDVYGGRARGSGDRWDTERFEYEHERNRFTDSRDRFDDRDSFGPRGGAFGGSRYRQHSGDDFDRRHSPPRRYDDRGPARYEEDRYEKKVYYDDEPRFERELPRRNRGESTNITIEKEREYFSPSPPRRAPTGRPTLLRRQSSLDTFDRKPLTRFSDREEYGPPARYRPEEPKLPPLVPIPLPRTRQLGPPPSRRYEEKDYYEEIRVAEPDYYGDEDFRGYPERIREREIVRSRRRSRSRSRSRDRQSRATRSVRSDSSSSRGTSVSGVTARSEFPKKGKTRMPARLVSKQAIIDLGYPFVEEGDIIIIQKALGRENIDEVIKLSEDYKKTESKPSIHSYSTRAPFAQP